MKATASFHSDLTRVYVRYVYSQHGTYFVSRMEQDIDMFVEG